MPSNYSNGLTTPANRSDSENSPKRTSSKPSENRERNSKSGSKAETASLSSLDEPQKADQKSPNLANGRVSAKQSPKLSQFHDVAKRVSHSLKLNLGSSRDPSPMAPRKLEVSILTTCFTLETVTRVLTLNLF